MYASSIVPAGTGTVPIIGRLNAIFDALPDDNLITTLRGPVRRGRPGYDPAVLWKCRIAFYATNTESTASFIRLLRDNALLAAACGIASPVGPAWRVGAVVGFSHVSGALGVDRVHGCS